MNYYELVLVLRPEMLSTDVDGVSEQMIEIIRSYKGSYFKSEYWGLLSLAYKIDYNKRGHYLLICFQGSKSCVDELNRKITLHSGIIRHNLLRVDKISTEQSPILCASSLNTDAQAGISV